MAGIGSRGCCVQLEERKRVMQSDLGSYVPERLTNRDDKNEGKNVVRKRGKKGPLNAQS